MPLAVVAIGGNALSRAGSTGTIEEQFASARETARQLVRLVRGGWDLVVTHGNGPQVGTMLWRVELARQKIHPIDLGICDANSQGQIGYMLQQVLSNAFYIAKMPHRAITLVTQVEVDRNDPAFDNPTKPIGPFFSSDDAEARKRDHGWVMKEDAGRGWRRVVPSPEPRSIAELPAIRAMARSPYIPIAVGGGGIPVARMEDGRVEGVEAVIDKDLTSSLLARELRADALVICTAVDRVAVGYQTDSPTWIDETSPGALREYLEGGEFPPGSMGPKIEAVLRYVEDDTGSPLRRAVITDYEHLIESMLGTAGTTVWPDGAPA
ncbi:MAG: carbamate kinase [Myxococcota bacterium]